MARLLFLLTAVFGLLFLCGLPFDNGFAVDMLLLGCLTGCGYAWKVGAR